MQVDSTGLCMMSVHREKVSKDKQGFIYGFGQDCRRLKLVFLSDTMRGLAM